MKFFLGLLLGAVIGAVVVAGVVYWRPEEKIAEKPKEYPLLKYTIENLSEREYRSEIVLDEEVSRNVFRFHFDSDEKRVNGLAHLPGGCNKCPVIVQFRGYQEREVYKPGNGTKRTAEKFAEAGFISLAPDFLGYGGSASPSADVFEARFETYTTALNLLSAVSYWPLADPDRVGIWGHSNGGQIALTVLVVSGKPYPTVLWAPVTAGFPYSVLFFMNDNSDGDRMLRRKLADFESDYDSRLFDFNSYLDRIVASTLILQGTADGSVPKKWSDDVVKRLNDLGKGVTYEVYPGADHNLVSKWGDAVGKSVEFFETNW